MSAFTYLRRIGNVQNLKRFAASMESQNPTLLKYIALRALSLGRSGKNFGDSDGNVLRELARSVLEHTLALKRAEWRPSELVSVMALLSIAEIELDGAKKRFFVEKTGSFCDFNAYDLVQLLNSAKNLGIEVDLKRLSAYIRNNLNFLLKNASVTNIYSLLSQLQRHGIRLDAQTISKIVDNCRARGNAALTFKELTNLYNSLARQPEGDWLSPGAAGALQKVDDYLEGLYARVLERIEADGDDLEGVVDAIDALVLWAAKRRVDAQGYLATLQKARPLFERAKFHLEARHGHHPKVLRVLVKNAAALNFDDARLMELVVSNYRESHAKWSLQGIEYSPKAVNTRSGNIDLIRSVLALGPLSLSFPLETWVECVERLGHFAGPAHIADIFVSSVLYNCVRKTRKAPLDRLIRSGRIPEPELLVGATVILLGDCTQLEGLSLASLRTLNAISFSSLRPLVATFRGDLGDAVRLVEGAAKSQFLTNSNADFVNFCNFSVMWT